MNEKLKRKELCDDLHKVSLMIDHLVFSPKYRGNMLLVCGNDMREGIICKTFVGWILR